MSDILKGMAERSQLLALLQEKYPQYHPAMSLVEIANAPDVELNYELKAKIHMNLLQYISPKLASQEVRQDVNITSGLLRVEYAPTEE
jgi:hypothetical protein